MEEQLLYLRPNILVEPLIDRWYAWAHLIPPATAARNITERHLRIIDSYLEDPEMHAAAVKNPKLLGGPFMDYPTNRIDDVAALKECVLSKRAHMIDLSEAISALDAMLREKATGHSLEPLYALVPEILRGYVELTYDLNNHPAYRLIEPLLYASSFYDSSMQSLMLSLISQDDRPFVLSTPRLDENGGLELRLPFDNPVIDDLFKLKKHPAPFFRIKKMLGLAGKEEELFRTFLTPEPPEPYRPYEGSGARWRYFGHACVLLETKTTSILLDPVLSYTYDSRISRYTYEDLPDVIDYVLITHNHQDHILFETLLQLRHRIRHIVVPRNDCGSLQDPSLRLTLEHCGFQNVIDMAEMQTIEFERGSITALPFLGEHADLAIRSKMAWLARVDGHSLLFAADSCNISRKMYQHVHAIVGDVEALFVGMECDGAPLSWLYGPLLTRKLERSMDRSRRLAGSNYERAMDIVDRFNCREVYVYAMGQEPWLNHVMSLKYTEQSNPIVESNRLIKTCAERGLVCERLFGEKEILLS